MQAKKISAKTRMKIAPQTDNYTYYLTVRSASSRISSIQCDDDSDYNGTGSGFFWYYLGASSRVPAIGQTTSGGTFNGSTLNGTVQRGGLPTTGGSTVKSSTTKGGFGGSSRGFG